MPHIKWMLIIFMYILLPVSVFSLETISVSIEANQYAVVGQPIEVSVMVTHEKNSKVDENSFKLGGSPLKVRFFKNVSLSEGSKLIISIYKFTIEPKKKGSYTIPSVSVKVGGKVYASYEAFYDVQ